MDNRKEAMNGMTEDALVSACSGLEFADFVRKHPSWTSEIYSFGKILREYGHYPQWLPLQISTDHGPAQHDRPNEMELAFTAPAHFYHSPRLVKLWPSFSNKPCYTLYSPYVYYRRKKNIAIDIDAKGTIAFPTHSTHFIDIISDWDKYIDQLLSLPERFQPVSVCLYFLDVKKGLHKIFQNRGIPVYTAGHWFDPDFVDRFYGILRRFRYGTSNSFGSYLFYCVELGLPFFMYGEKPRKYNNGDSNVPKGGYTNDNYNQIKNLESLFGAVTDKISPEQKRTVEQELGLNDGLTRFMFTQVLYKAYLKVLCRRLYVPVVVFVTKVFKRMIDRRRKRQVSDTVLEESRLSGLARYSKTTTDLLGKMVQIADGASFLAMYKEIFLRNIYQFSTDSNKPYIIDAGSNIGLSIIYFKKLYPNAEIVSFEPDRQIFEMLCQNVKAFNCTDTTLINKGVWNEEASLKFYEEGADSGRVVTGDEAGPYSFTSVDVVPLRSFLSRRVDLLKLDIEGAELTVLEDCAPFLKNVDKIFVEFHSFPNSCNRLSRLLGILEEAGFKTYVESSNIISEKPFIKRPLYNGMDFQLNIFGFRE